VRCPAREQVKGATGLERRWKNNAARRGPCSRAGVSTSFRSYCLKANLSRPHPRQRAQRRELLPPPQWTTPKNLGHRVRPRRGHWRNPPTAAPRGRPLHLGLGVAVAFAFRCHQRRRKLLRLRLRRWSDYWRPGASLLYSTPTLGLGPLPRKMLRFEDTSS